MPSDPGAPITIIVSAAELTLLEKLDFPCLQHVLATARRTEEGIALEGRWADLDSLAGWVAGGGEPRSQPQATAPDGAARQHR